MASSIANHGEVKKLYEDLNSCFKAYDPKGAENRWVSRFLTELNLQGISYTAYHAGDEVWVAMVGNSLAMAKINLTNCLCNAHSSEVPVFGMKSFVRGSLTFDKELNSTLLNSFHEMIKNPSDEASLKDFISIVRCSEKLVVAEELTEAELAEAAPD